MREMQNSILFDLACLDDGTHARYTGTAVYVTSPLGPILCARYLHNRIVYSAY